VKTSYRWLEACVPGGLPSPDEVAERLASRGFPVEEAHDLSGGLGDIVVGHVLTVRPHPNADRLRLCEVDGGAGIVQVVCGAPNVQPDGWYPLAPVGAALPGGMKISKAKLRGEWSEGMLCSEKELGLGSGTEGLMTLEGPFTPGASFVRALGLDDVRMEVEVTANRPDLLSHLGIARELGSAGAKPLMLPAIPGGTGEVPADLARIGAVQDPSEVAEGGASLRVEAPDLCYRYLGLVLRGVRVGPSPGWLQARLRAIGARPINNVVDATNYVLYELGQPLHAFDMDKLRGARVVVRRARVGEKLRTLDGLDRDLSPGMLAICDGEGPVAVAGVIGGADSEVTDRTRNVFLECALFEPKSIRSTRKALGLSTEASYRFERGVDPEGLTRAILRAAEIIMTTAGGGPDGRVLDVCARPFERATVKLREARIERLLGVPFESARVRGLLEPLGFALGAGDGGFEVEVPGFRSYDVTREVDLIEEIARTEGFDAFPDALRPYRPSLLSDHPLFAAEDRVREELVASGFLEAQTPAFASRAHGEVEIANPMSAEEGFLRAALLPGLEARLVHNLNRGNREVRLFEIGTAFRRGEVGGLPAEESHLAAILHGHREPLHWSNPAVEADAWDMKGLVERVAALVSGGKWRVAPAEGSAGDGAFAEGTTLNVTDPGGRVFGRAGRVGAARLDLPVWAREVWGLEIAFPLEPLPPATVVYAPLPVHPGVERDLALLVPVGVPVSRVLARIQVEGGTHLAGTEVFDVYRGEGLPADTRSVAVRLRFQAPDRTLTDDEVDEAVRRITRVLQEGLGVGFRGRQG
jgi:phenylalanyl-tRNA synthetase beta chain